MVYLIAREKDFLKGVYGTYFFEANSEPHCLINILKNQGQDLRRVIRGYGEGVVLEEPSNRLYKLIRHPGS